MKTLTVVLLLFISGMAVAQDVPILVTPEWLNEHQKDASVVILRTGFLKWDYDAEHLPGASFLWVPSLAPDTQEGGSMNAPDLKQATKLLQSLGVSNSSHIILSHVRNEVSPTARIFLTLEQLGMKGRVSFLNGGLEAWKKAGFAVTKEIPLAKKGKFKPKPEVILVDKNYVLNRLTSETSTIVDARMTRFYNGEPTGNPRDGHITGAKNIPYTDMIDQTTNTFKPLDQIQPYFTSVDESKKKELVAYCFIGQTASVVYMAGRMLGYNMKLYDGSLQEWSRIKELPMEVTPTEKK
jgi:Rhodanese-related sulfurtransferase